MVSLPPHTLCTPLLLHTYNPPHHARLPLTYLPSLPCVSPFEQPIPFPHPPPAHLPIPSNRKSSSLSNATSTAPAPSSSVGITTAHTSQHAAKTVAYTYSTATGQLVDEHTLPTPRPPLQLEWDGEGEHLAVLQDGSSVLCLWSVHGKGKLRQVEMGGVKDPSYMCWSRVGGQLAVGTQKGNLLIYNVHSLKSISVAGKHSKKITCGAWNNDNKLALASLDRMLTISDEKGELIEQAKLKYDPFDIQFSAQKVDDTTPPSESESTVSINMGRQTVLLYNMHDSDNPVELAFQSKYGEIVSYWWFGDGYLMIGFSRGYLIAISTHMREIGEELQSMKMFESALTSLCYSPNLNKLAVSGDDGVKLVDMSDWKEMKSDQVRFGQDEGDVEHMAWTTDGQILTVSTTGGYVFNYLTSIPQLSAAHHSHLLYLSSLRSLSLFDASTAADPDSHVQSWDVAVEPTFLALSGRWLGCWHEQPCVVLHAGWWWRWRWWWR